MRSLLGYCSILAVSFALPSCVDEPLPPAALTQTAAEKMCAAMTAQLETCAAPSACQEALVADCADVVGVFSDAYLEAITGCLDGGVDSETCLFEAVQNLVPSAAQRAFADQFCSSCLFGVPQCADTLFQGAEGDAKAVGTLLLPLSDALVDTLASECASSFGCLATFSSCAQGVLAQRAIPEQTVACLFESLTSGSVGNTCKQEEPGSGGAGGSDAVGGAGGGGGAMSCPDGNEPNDASSSATPLDATGEGKSHNCDPAQSIAAVLAGTNDDDWYIFEGVDDLLPCLSDPQPHASVAANEPLAVCMYLIPNGSSAPPSCLEGTPDVLAGGYGGCCGETAVRLQYGEFLTKDDTTVLVHVSSLGDADVCIDYTLTYNFGRSD